MRKLLTCFIFLIILVPGLLFANIIEFNFTPESAITFQNEGSPTEVDQTAILNSVDGQWAPGIVKYDFYNNGISTAYWDAISLNFGLEDLSGAPLDLNCITDATLRFYAQKGSYYNNTWEHYFLLPGEFNPEYQDIIVNNPVPIDVNGAELFTEGWVEANIPLDWITQNDLGLTLRLWNLRVDGVELNVANNCSAPVPEPSTLLLLIFNLGGIIAFRARKPKGV